MKRWFLNILALIGMTIILTCCEIDDIKPKNALTEENVITNETTARIVLNGVYAKTRTPNTAISGFVTEFLGNGLENLSAGNGLPNLAVNDVMSTNAFVSSYYVEQYQLINQANWFITLMEEGKAAGISEERKNEMIGEARCLRALSYFNLLRVYGQFYDLQSAFGVVIRTDPSQRNEVSARSTVKDVYDVITADLNFAAQYGPADVTHRYVGRTTAAALLAKVHLYMGDYTSAAAEALKVINNEDGYALETKYEDVFLKRFDSKETFFAPFVDGVNETTNSITQIQSTTYSEALQLLADEEIAGEGDLTGTGSGYDPRFSYVYADDTKGPNENGKYPLTEYDLSGANEPAGNTFHVLRMAEIYLIYAEAKARLSGGVDAEAVARVNEIRHRAGADLMPIAPATKQELLQAIYKEKFLELVGENGEHWFDIVRYDRLGDLSAVAEKPTVNNANKLIMPMPQTARAGNRLLTQNPGYLD